MRRPLSKVGYRSSNPDSISQITDITILKRAKDSNEKGIYVEAFGERYQRMRKMALKLKRRGLLKEVASYDNGSYYIITDEGKAFIIEDASKRHKKLVKQLQKELA